MDTKKLRQKILDLAIRGKLVPQDPNDEPASVLLERIRAEKERLIKEGKIKRSKKTAEDETEAPFDIPMSWEWCRLEYIVSPDCTLGYGIVQPMEDVLNGIPVIRPVDLTSPIIGIKGLKRIDEKISNSYQRTILKGGEILFCVRASVGKVGIASGQLRGANVTRGISPLRFDFEYLTKYVFYHLQSLFSQTEIKSYSRGATLQQINVEDLKLLLIAVPPLSEQKRIVDEIERWFSVIDELESNEDDLLKAIDKAKSKILDLAIHGKLVPQDPNDEPAIELLKRINPKFEPCKNELDDFQLPDNWCWVSLGNIGKWQSGATPSRMQKDYYGGEIPWLKTGDLNDGFINIIPETITQKALEETSVKLNPKGSVLVAMYGATIGKIGILSFPAATNQACCACVDFYGIEQMYLFYYLLSQKDYFVRLGGGGAQPNISKEKIIETMIPLPPKAEQLRIVAKIEEVFKALDALS